MFDTNIFNILDLYDDIVIVTHTNPDGDAIGSAFAVAFCLEKLNKNPKVIIEEYEERYNVIPGKKFLFKGDIESLNPELFISVDCGGMGRFGGNTKQLYDKAKATINIDHHDSNDSYSDYNFVEPMASSTCEIVYNIFNKNIEFDKNIASCIYAGIVYDSGGFKFRSAKSETLKIAAELMDFGISYTKIYYEMVSKKSLKEIRVLEKSLDNMEYDEKNNVIYSFITLKELEKLEAGKHETGGIVQFLMNIDDVKVAVFIYETSENVFKISFRSVELDVNKVASKFGGGGHINAAGATFNGTKEETLSSVKEELLLELLK